MFAHSDTLFSALINSYVKINNADEFVKAFKHKQINISSLFYYLKSNDKIIYFLPKPAFLETDSKSDGNHKLRNKIKFVTLSVWENGFDQENWANQSTYKIVQNEFILTKKEYDDIIKEAGIPEISICRIIQSPKSPIRKNAPDDSIYYQADIEIASNNSDSIETGFYFLYEVENGYETMLKDAVNIMSKSGIGGEKNNMGQIMSDPEFDELEINIQSDKFTNVSVVSPEDYEDFKQISLYKSFVRGGRNLKHGKPYQTVRMIKEGALATQFLKGHLVEIGTDDFGNTALRNGNAFLIPVP